jgi:CheY-like chemotaxis protein
MTTLKGLGMDSFARTPVILVLADVEETRTGIERLLSVDGYRVLAAKGPADSARMSRDVSPDLVLMSLGVARIEPVLIARQIRNAWDLDDDVPIVLFAVTTLEEGAEVKVEPNIYLTHPDNFNQLRKLISRLVGRPERIH